MCNVTLLSNAKVVLFYGKANVYSTKVCNVTLLSNVKGCSFSYYGGDDLPCADVFIFTVTGGLLVGGAFPVAPTLRCDGAAERAIHGRAVVRCLWKRDDNQHLVWRQAVNDCKYDDIFVFNQNFALSLQVE